MNDYLNRTMEGWRTLNETKGDQMETKLTARQNEIISEVLGKFAAENCDHSLPESLKFLRETLVSELKAVSSETANY